MHSNRRRVTSASFHNNQHLSISESDDAIVEEKSASSDDIDRIKVPYDKEIESTIQEEIVADFVGKLGLPVYKIVNFNKNKLRIWIGGCNGTLEDTRNDAQVMNSLIENKLIKGIDLGINLGDKNYPSGYESLNDSKFNEYYEAYARPDLTHIATTSILWVSGNHDAARKKSLVPLAKYYMPTYVHHFLPADTNHAAIEMNQVFHAYQIRETDPKIDGTKIEFYNRTLVDYTKLPKVVMPALAYSFIFGQVQLFIINSNNFVKDFFELMKQILPLAKISDEESEESKNYLNFPFLLQQLIDQKLIDPVKNQAAALFIEHNEARKAGRTILCFEHHPWFTVGKRAYKGGSDAFLYIEDEEMKKVDLLLQVIENNPKAIDVQILKSIMTVDTNNLAKMSSIPPVADRFDDYNSTLGRINHVMKTVGDLLATAHDHNFYYYNSKKAESKPAEKAEESESAEKGKEIESVEKRKESESAEKGKESKSAKANNGMCQITNGSNDTEQHPRTYFGDKESVGAFTTNRTTVVLTIDVKNPQGRVKVDAFIHTSGGIRNLRFFSDLSQSHPVRYVDKHPDQKDKLLEKVRLIVLRACGKYQEFLDSRQRAKSGAFYKHNGKHKSSQEMDEIMILLNQYKTYKLEELAELIATIEIKNSGHSLYRIIFNELEEARKTHDDKEPNYIDLEIIDKLCPEKERLKLRSN